MDHPQQRPSEQNGNGCSGTALLKDYDRNRWTAPDLDPENHCHPDVPAHPVPAPAHQADPPVLLEVEQDFLPDEAIQNRQLHPHHRHSSPSAHGMRLPSGQSDTWQGQPGVPPDKLVPICPQWLAKPVLR